MIIKLLGFFLGFFITIILINYLTIENLKIETFKNLDKFTDATPTPATPASATPTPATPTPASPVAKTPDDLANSRLIPSKDNKYMCINTFNTSSTGNKIINAEKRWYECDLESIIGIERNEKHYFKTLRDWDRFYVKLTTKSIFLRHGDENLATGYTLFIPKESRLCIS